MRAPDPDVTKVQFRNQDTGILSQLVGPKDEPDGTQKETYCRQTTYRFTFVALPRPGRSRAPEHAASLSVSPNHHTPCSRSRLASPTVFRERVTFLFMRVHSHWGIQPTWLVARA